MNQLLYILGALLVGAGICYALSVIGLSSTWIAVAALIILGAGIMGAVANGRTRKTDHNTTVIKS